MKLEKYAHNPILSPEPGHGWESLSVCNPGVWYEDGTFYMLYRAAGDDAEHRIHFGLATSKDGFRFERAGSESGDEDGNGDGGSPVLSPSADGPDAGCIEDPRIVKFGDVYYITYAYRPFPPGRYWLNKGNDADKTGAEMTQAKFLADNLTQSGLLATKDFRKFQRLGRITKGTVDDRDVILFPEQVGGRYVMLHRPKEWVGGAYGTEYPAIWMAFSDDLLSWSGGRLLVKGETWWEKKIGGSTPPLRTDRGWLTLYHGVDEKGLYRTGALMLDLDDPSRVLARTKDFIMEPEHDYETVGLYNGVAFPTGNVIVDGSLYVYYGGADKYCAVATAPVEQLVDFIFANGAR